MKMDISNLEHNETLLKMEEIQDELNKHRSLEDECSKKTTELQNTTSEARKRLLSNYKSPEKRGNSIIVDSDSDDEPFSQTISPRKTTKASPKAAILGLTPTKAGISKFNPAECSFIDWLNSLETTFEWLRSSNISDEQIIRLIIMSLPTSLSWVGNHLDERAKKNLKLANTNLIELIMGSQGTISDFLSAKKMLQEHPLSYLHRLKNYLEASNININDNFALKSTLDRLYANLDQSTVVELKRKLVNVTSFDQISKTLKDVVQLTNNNQKVASLMNSVTFNDDNQLGSLNLIRSRQTGIGPCYFCGRMGHLKRDCKRRPQKKETIAKDRESRTEKEGRNSYWCKKHGRNSSHSTKYCKSKDVKKTD